jgi:hypothetical protein
MEWLYCENAVLKDELLNYRAFVYIITNTLTGKQYIGKKKIFFTRMKRVKESKRRIRQVKESDWEEYWGSSEALAKDLVKHGKENFTREILHLCKSPAEASYYEIKEQLFRDVLLHPAQYYNNFIGCKIHRNHLVKKAL